MGCWNLQGSASRSHRKATWSFTSVPWFSKHLSCDGSAATLAALLQQAEKPGRFVCALTGPSAYYNWEKYCTPTFFSVHLLKKCITVVWYISCHWLISKAVLSGKQNLKKGLDWGDSQISFLLLVTELVRRAIWKMSKYCGLVGLMKSVIFIQMALLKSIS